MRGWRERSCGSSNLPVGTYEDYAIRGPRAAGQRPRLDSLLKDANCARFDIVAAWSVDPIGRSLQDLLTFRGEIQALGIDLYPHRQGLDTTTPTGKAMFEMCGLCAKFERSIVHERVNAGLARARTNGKRFGRPSVGEEA